MLPMVEEMLIQVDKVNPLLRLSTPASRKFVPPSRVTPAPAAPAADPLTEPFVAGSCNVLSANGKLVRFKCQTRSKSEVVAKGAFQTAPLVFEAAAFVWAGLPQYAVMKS